MERTEPNTDQIVHKKYAGLLGPTTIRPIKANSTVCSSEEEDDAIKHFPADRAQENSFQFYAKFNRQSPPYLKPCQKN